MVLGLLKAGVLPVDCGVGFPVLTRDASMRSLATLLGLSLVAFRLDELAELADRHFVNTRVERFGDLDLVQRSFMGLASGLAVGRSHRKLAGRYEIQLHADAVLNLH